MPINILNRQRELARVGKIRMGDPPKPGKNFPSQRDTYRFTSSNKAALEMLQKEYGGILRPWDGHPGQWELDSKANQIKVIVDTTFSVDENFERYDGKTRTHFCDGVECKFIEIRREGKRIVECEEKGYVPCLCDQYGLGEDVEKRECDLVTKLRVMLPATEDVVLWEFASKGAIFNKEVYAAIETFRQMGIRQGYCLLTIDHLSKTVGNDVTRWGVARLTLDPNPPNFVAKILGNTPAAQALALAETARQPALAASAGGRPAPALSSASGPSLPPARENGGSDGPDLPANYLTLERPCTVPEQTRAVAYMKRVGFTPAQLADLKAAAGGIDWRFALLEAERRGLATPGEALALIRGDEPTPPPPSNPPEETPTGPVDAEFRVDAEGGENPKSDNPFEGDAAPQEPLL